MARFAITVIIDEATLAVAEADNTVRVTVIDNYTDDSDLLVVGLTSESLRNFIEYITAEDWAESILNAEIVADN